MEGARHGPDRRVLGKPLRELHTAGAGVLVLDVHDTRFDSPEAYLSALVEDEAKREPTGRRFRQLDTVRDRAGGAGPTLRAP